MTTTTQNKSDHYGDYIMKIDGYFSVLFFLFFSVAVAFSFVIAARAAFYICFDSGRERNKKNAIDNGYDYLLFSLQCAPSSGINTNAPWHFLCNIYVYLESLRCVFFLLSWQLTAGDAMLRCFSFAKRVYGFSIYCILRQMLMALLKVIHSNKIANFASLGFV